MDKIFGADRFRNEIIWHYTGWNKKLGSKFESRTDTLLFLVRLAAAVGLTAAAFAIFELIDWLRA